MTYIHMQMCRNSDDQDISGDFADQAAAEAWIEEAYPGWLDESKEIWESPDREPFPGYIKQYGMNHHWVWFELVEGDLPAFATL